MLAHAPGEALTEPRRGLKRAASGAEADGRVAARGAGGRTARADALRRARRERGAAVEDRLERRRAGRRCPCSLPDHDGALPARGRRGRADARSRARAAGYRCVSRVRTTCFTRSAVSHNSVGRRLEASVARGRVAARACRRRVLERGFGGRRHGRVVGCLVGHVVDRVVRGRSRGRRRRPSRAMRAQPRTCPHPTGPRRTSTSNAVGSSVLRTAARHPFSGHIEPAPVAKTMLGSSRPPAPSACRRIASSRATSASPRVTIARSRAAIAPSHARIPNGPATLRWSPARMRRVPGTIGSPGTRMGPSRASSRSSRATIGCARARMRSSPGAIRWVPATIEGPPGSRLRKPSRFRALGRNRPSP